MSFVSLHRSTRTQSPSMPLAWRVARRVLDGYGGMDAVEIVDPEAWKAVEGGEVGGGSTGGMDPFLMMRVYE